MPNSPGPDFSMRQELSFSESCLPKTMTMALRNRHRIAAKLGPESEGWPFEDQVLVWLAEHWKADVAGYRSGSNPEMAKRFDSDQLAHLDEHYARKLGERLVSGD